MFGVHNPYKVVPPTTTPPANSSGVGKDRPKAQTQEHHLRNRQDPRASRLPAARVLVDGRRVELLVDRSGTSAKDPGAVVETDIRRIESPVGGDAAGGSKRSVGRGAFEHVVGFRHCGVLCGFEICEGR